MEQGAAQLKRRAVPAEHKQWLTTQLAHAHEPTFRRRVRDLIAEAGPQIDEVFGPIKRAVESHLVNARNAVTHWDPSDEGPSGLALAALRMAADAIFDLVLLNHVGLNDADVADTAAAHRHKAVA